MLKKELHTYKDLIDFMNGVQSEINRLRNGNEECMLKSGKVWTLQEKKINLLEMINLGFCLHMTGLVTSSSTPSKINYFLREEPPSAQPFDLLNSNQFNKSLDYIKSYAKFYGPYENAAKCIDSTLGTHQNWFKWLLSFLFPAPKSKQFMDGYSLFKQPHSVVSEPQFNEHIREHGL